MKDVTLFFELCVVCETPYDPLDEDDYVEMFWLEEGQEYRICAFWDESALKKSILGSGWIEHEGKWICADCILEQTGSDAH